MKKEELLAKVGYPNSSCADDFDYNITRLEAKHSVYKNSTEVLYKADEVRLLDHGNGVDIQIGDSFLNLHYCQLEELQVLLYILEKEGHQSSSVNISTIKIYKREDYA